MHGRPAACGLQPQQLTNDGIDGPIKGEGDGKGGNSHGCNGRRQQLKEKVMWSRSL